MEQARAGFRPGLYRHYKGGLYVATGLAVSHESFESDSPDVVYHSVTYGRLTYRPLAKPGEDSWSDQVQWPTCGVPINRWAAGAVQPGSEWPYEHLAPRFLAIPPFRTLLLFGGPAKEGALEATALAGQIPGIECHLMLGGAPRTVGLLRSLVTSVPVLSIWVSRADQPPPPQGYHLMVQLGSNDFVLGQLYGILACVPKPPDAEPQTGA